MYTPPLCQVCYNLGLRQSKNAQRAQNFRLGLMRHMRYFPRTLEDEKIYLDSLMATAGSTCETCNLLRRMADLQSMRGGHFSFRRDNFILRGDNKPLRIEHWPSHISFYIYSAQEPNPSSFTLGTRPIDASKERNDDGEAFDFLQDCFTGCLAGPSDFGHPYCEEQYPSPLPRRLLHVGEIPFKLIEVGEESGIYAALSYCWGPHPENHFRTLSTNLDDMRKEIKWEDLPPVFKDTITVVRRLGLEYLWIDSLCIVQDSVEDWEVESSKMGRYYKGAYFTVAASSSANPSEPFLGRRHAKFQQLKGNFGPHTIFCERFHNQSPNQDIDASFLATRGWTFQEAALSQRVIHYRAGGIVWECKSKCVRQGNTHSWQGDLPNDQMPKLLEGINPARADDWLSLISEYSGRRFTRYTDKLPAFSGIASSVHETTAMTYLAGLWKEMLPLSLLWVTTNGEPPRPMPVDEGSPSWSWASIDGGIEIYNCRDPRAIGNKIKNSVELLHCACVPVGLNPYGQTRGGYITVLGEVTVARLLIQDGSFCMLAPLKTPLSAPLTQSLLKVRFRADTYLEECVCKTPLFQGIKTLRRRPACATSEIPTFINTFVELLLIVQCESGSSKYLALGRSETIHGAHVRLGVLETSKSEMRNYRSGELRNPIYLTIV